MSGLLFERLKTSRGEWPTALRKDYFPEGVRVQCWQIWNTATGGRGEETCGEIVKKLRFALGVPALNNTGYYRDRYRAKHYSARRELEDFFLNGLASASEKQNAEYILSALELICQHIEQIYSYQSSSADEVITIINHRLRLAGVGFKYVSGMMMVFDDENLTTSAVEPTVSLLNRPEFKRAYGYLAQAYNDYRSGSAESLETAIDNALKSAETLLKIIFDDLEIPYNAKDTYMPLILKAKENGLFVNISDDKLNPLMNNLKASGEIRNRGGGHGAPHHKATDRLVRLALHHVTADMLYIAETYLESKEKNEASGS